MKKPSKEQRLAELREVRNYVIDVIAAGVTLGRGNARVDFEQQIKKLEAQESKIMDILDAD